ncbi:hypothetical protein [Spirillospora albida]|uniref:hypothetical protein n=1 Tax=Spirillospora albida TaxID=58123 RepID=UPI0004C127E4|nr:hypothetical protein [Spirillospora albida]
MSAQAVEPFGCEPPEVPRTIGAISEALPDDLRRLFLEQVMTARQGPELDDVITAWWAQATLERDPDHARRLADAMAGRDRVPLAETLRRRSSG